MRDENALESALARPRHRWSYNPETSLLDLAASYGCGLATSHGYSDGNQRIAFVAMYSRTEKLDQEKIGQWLERYTEPYQNE